MTVSLTSEVYHLENCATFVASNLDSVMYRLQTNTNDLKYVVIYGKKNTNV